MHYAGAVKGYKGNRPMLTYTVPIIKDAGQ